MEGVMTSLLATLGSYLLISLAMGLLTQSSVLGLLSAIGIPFLTATAVPLATLTGSELFIDVVRAVDLPGAAVALGDGRAGAFELLRSEEHTSELQSRGHLVCRLLLE